MVVNVRSVLWRSKLSAESANQPLKRSVKFHCNSHLGEEAVRLQLLYRSTKRTLNTIHVALGHVAGNRIMRYVIPVVSDKQNQVAAFENTATCCKTFETIDEWRLIRSLCERIQVTPFRMRTRESLKNSQPIDHRCLWQNRATTEPEQLIDSGIHGMAF